MNEPVQQLKARPVNEEDAHFLRLAREELPESLKRIEETARYIIGAVGAVAGLFLAGMQVKIAVIPKGGPPGLSTAPLWLWGVSMLLAVLTIFPFPYVYYKGSPESFRRYLKTARWVKWFLLLFSALTFGAGLILAARQF